MPRSVVIYTSHDTFSELKRLATKAFEAPALKPYTTSFPHKTEEGRIRVRITELREDSLMPVVTFLAKRGGVTFASPADRDVRDRAYEELIQDGDRCRRTATLQFASPTIVDVAGQAVPFPVIPVVFERYTEAWNTFSEVKLPTETRWLRYLRVTDFKISCLASPYGVGAQGWVALEMEQGRSEEEIGLFNTLVDFAFYCGTGLHTDQGLGQTRKIEKTQRTQQMKCLVHRL